MQNYIADLPGGTATTSIQFKEGGSVKEIAVSYLSTASGKIEISTSVASQIGTTQPTADVLARLNCSGTAGNVFVRLPLTLRVKAFDILYVHQTGTGNLGTVTLFTS